MAMKKNRSPLNPLSGCPDRPKPARVAIIGAGTIGPDIGYYLKSALPELTLYLVDVAPTALERAVERIAAYSRKGVARGKLTEEAAARVNEKIVTTLDYREIADCDWVLEAATENLELKHAIFDKVEAVVGADALITSNTSSLPAARLFSGLTHKERATVTHFFAPAFRNPAVEVVDWKEVDPKVVEYLRWLFCVTGKVPLVTSDAICFMLDRVFDNWCNEAAYLLDGATAAEIDSVAGEYVHAGPFFVLNLAHGNPIIVETNTLQMEEGEHYRPAPILRSVESWVTTPPGKKVDVDPAVARQIRDRLLGVLFSQSVDIIDRGIGSREDLNLGCALALGFKKGPFDLMRDLGQGEVQRIFERLERQRPGLPQPSQELGEYQEFSRHLLVDDLDDVKLITLRRPQAMNALDDEVTTELLATIRRYEDDPNVTGFIIIGYGNRAFCAGADIGRFPEVLGSAKDAEQYARECSRLLVHIDQMSKPVVAALNGMALGGGLELALRCHGIVAQRHAWLQFPEVRLGIAPGIGGMVVPYRKWPDAAPLFHEMLQQARKLDANQAHECGVVDELADSHDGLLRIAVERVRALAGSVRPPTDGPVDIPAVGKIEGGGLPLSREVVGIIGEAIGDAARAATLADALEVGYAAFGASACTPAAREGVSAFMEKRKSDFTKTG